MNSSTEAPVVLGKLVGLHGFEGWFKVYSWTIPRDNILEYPSWLIADGQGGWQSYQVLNGHPQGPGLVAQIEDVATRDQALAMLQREVAVPRGQLPKADADEYYWYDLVGSEVVTTEGVALGCLEHIFSTAANDVLVVREGNQDGDEEEAGTERLIPFLRPNVVTEIILKSVECPVGKITVDWDPDF